MDLYSPNISRIIDGWIEEDIGKGDLTSSAITKKKRKSPLDSKRGRNILWCWNNKRNFKKN